MKLSLSAKYRPRILKDVYLQTEVSSYLRAVVSRPEDSIKYFFLSGGYGCGKTTLARAFANQLLKVDDCLKSPNYIEIDSSEKRIQEHFDDVKNLIFSETTGYRVVTIDECHLLAPDVSQKLLKILEDFVGNVFIFFCLPEQDEVYSDRGLVSVKDLVPGDVIQSSTGKVVVKNVFSSGKKEVFRIKTDYTEIDASASHPFRVVTPDGLVWKTVSELVEGDILPIFKSNGDASDCILTNKECEFVGHMVGDGYWNQLPGNNVHFGILFREDEAEYGKQLLDSCGLKYSSVTKGRIEEFTIFRPNGISEHYDKFGFAPYSSEGKRLPSTVHYMNSEQFDWFIKGWDDADGTSCCLSNPQINISYSHKALADDLIAELKRRGVPFTVKVKEPKYKELKFKDHVSKGDYGLIIITIVRNFYHRTVDWNKDLARAISSKVDCKPIFRYKANNGNDSYSPVQISKKLLDEFTGLGSSCIGYANIRSIESIGEQDTYDIEVDSDEHEFIVRGHSVHNCTTDAQLVPNPLKSRCLQFTLHGYTTQQCVVYAKQILEREGLTLSDKAVEIAALNSQGHIRDLLQQLDIIRFQGEEYFLKSYSTLWQGLDNFFYDFNKSRDDVMSVLLQYHAIQLKAYVSNYMLNNLVKGTGVEWKDKMYPRLVLPKIYNFYLKLLAQISESNSDEIYSFLYVFRDFLNSVRVK